MIRARVDNIAKALVHLGFDNLLKFDFTEPEYQTFIKIKDKIKDSKNLALIGICAGIIDYQLTLGGADVFWKTLESLILQNLRLTESISSIKELFLQFMEQPINSRLKNQKIYRLMKLFNKKFHEWFIKNYQEILNDPILLWETLAQTLDNKMYKKTIVFAIKVFDLVHFILYGDYCALPPEIPIPCDLHIKNVALTSGLVESASSEITVRGAWAKVAEITSKQLGHNISLLRIDSLVWQLGRMISTHRYNKNTCIEQLIKYMKQEVDIPEDRARIIAEELTWRLEVLVRGKNPLK